MPNKRGIVLALAAVAALFFPEVGQDAIAQNLDAVCASVVALIAVFQKTQKD